MRELMQVPTGFRQMLEELADLAVLLLDELEGDVDLEDGGDTEPNGDERDYSFIEDGNTVCSCFIGNDIRFVPAALWAGRRGRG